MSGTERVQKSTKTDDASKASCDCCEVAKILTLLRKQSLIIENRVYIAVDHRLCSEVETTVN